MRHGGQVRVLLPENRQREPHRPDRRHPGQQQQLGHGAFPGVGPLLPDGVHVQNPFLSPFHRLPEFRLLVRNIVRLSRQKFRVIRHIPDRQCVPPVQPSPGQLTQFILPRGLFQSRNPVLSALPVLQLRKEAEARQPCDFPVRILRPGPQALRQGIQSVGALQRCPPQAEAPEAPPQKDLRGPGHRLPQIDHQRLRTGLLHRVAQLQHRLSRAQRVQQAADAAVHPGLIRQSGILRVFLIPALQGRPVHEEPAGRLGISGVQHTVRPAQRLFPVPGGPDASAQPGLFQDHFAVSGQQLRHGAVLLFQDDLRVPFLPGKKKVC